MIIMVKVLPVPAEYNHSLMVSVVIHGSSIALLSLGVAALWASMVFWGNVSYKIIFRMIRLPIPTFNVWMPLVEKLPMAVAVGLISMAIMANGGLALILSCWVYFMLLSKMYEDFLEEFVYNTAKEIAMKLFGKFVKRRRMRKPSTRPDPQMQALLDHEKTLAIQQPLGEGEEETEEQKAERELNRLLKESIEKQKKAADAKSDEEKKQREEYEGINEGLSPLNFHFTLFLFLVVLTVLNVPSAITWAKNFDHMPRTVDASTVPAVMTIAALAVIWQMKTPRSMAKGYQILAMVFYGMAMVTIIYCLDSPFLLNNVIATLFVLVALHQVLAPKMIILGLEEEDDDEEKEKEESEDKEKDDKKVVTVESQPDETNQNDDDDEEEDGDEEDETEEDEKKVE